MNTAGAFAYEAFSALSVSRVMQEVDLKQVYKLRRFFCFSVFHDSFYRWLHRLYFRLWSVSLTLPFTSCLAEVVFAHRLHHLFFHSLLCVSCSPAVLQYIGHSSQRHYLKQPNMTTVVTGHLFLGTATHTEEENTLANAVFMNSLLLLMWEQAEWRPWGTVERGFPVWNFRFCLPNINTSSLHLFVCLQSILGTSVILYCEGNTG